MLAAARADPPLPLRVGKVLISGQRRRPHPVLGVEDDPRAGGETEPQAAWVPVARGNVPLQHRRAHRLQQAGLGDRRQPRDIGAENRIRRGVPALCLEPLHHADLGEDHIHLDAGPFGEGVQEWPYQELLAVRIEVDLAVLGRRRQRRRYHHRDPRQNQTRPAEHAPAAAAVHGRNPSPYPHAEQTPLRSFGSCERFATCPRQYDKIMVPSQSRMRRIRTFPADNPTAPFEPAVNVLARFRHLDPRYHPYPNPLTVRRRASDAPARRPGNGRTRRRPTALAAVRTR